MTHKRHPQFWDAILALFAGLGMVGLMYWWRDVFSWSLWMYVAGFIFVSATGFGKLTTQRAMTNLANKDISRRSGE